MATMTEFKTSEKAWWCPGCGDFGVLASLQKALVNLGLEPENVVIVAGIGCSGKIGNYVNGYNLHVVHGRTMPATMGVKMANRDLTVIGAGGDGDGFAIGMGHFMHAVRRNVNMTYLVMDNQIYGLTKGQTSPTSDSGFVTKSTPRGNIERPMQQLAIAIAAGATFVAQGFSSNQAQLTKLIEAGIKHNGFSLINTYSPCVTYNKVNTYDWFKQNLHNLDDDPNYDPHDKAHALQMLMERGDAVTGLIYEDPETRSYDDLLPGFREKPIALQDLSLPQKDFDKILAEFR